MPTAWLVFIFLVPGLAGSETIRPRRVSVGFSLVACVGFTAMGIATVLFLVPLLIAALFLRWPGASARRVGGAAAALGRCFLRRVAGLDP